MQESTGFCRNCDRQVLIRRKSTNHVLHLLLTLCTFGLWLIIWLLVGVRVGGWRCSACGSPTRAKIPILRTIILAIGVGLIAMMVITMIAVSG